MSITTLTWLTLGACVLFVITLDANVYDYLVLVSRAIGIQLQRQWFKIRYHPDSPWVRWEIDRNADKMANELLKHYKQEEDNGSSGFDQ